MENSNAQPLRKYKKKTQRKKHKEAKAKEHKETTRESDFEKALKEGRVIYLSEEEWYDVLGLDV